MDNGSFSLLIVCGPLIPSFILFGYSYFWLLPGAEVLLTPNAKKCGVPGSLTNIGTLSTIQFQPHQRCPNVESMYNEKYGGVLLLVTVGSCYFATLSRPPLAFLAPRTLEDMGIRFTFIIGVVTRAFNFL